MEWACELYIAPSTIPNAGLGIFTGKTLRPGDTIGSTGDIAIPMIDWVWRNARADGKYFRDPFSDYVWSGGYMGMRREVDDNESIATMWPGLDAAINSFPPLINVERSIPDYDPDINGTMHRSKDPAMGSFSPYFGGLSLVSNYVPEGGELFKDYGTSWFIVRNMKFPLDIHISDAEQFLRQFSGTIPSKAKPVMYQLILDLKELWKRSKILQAIPDSWESAQSMVQYPNPRVIKRKLREWYQPNATRSLPWLQEHGTCLDSIQTAPSTLVGAGRGAFATRAFEVGEIVTTSPLIHVLNKTMLQRQGGRLDLSGGQLLINYCFSHPEISLALCPYGKGVNSINHHAPDKVNVRLEWPPDQFLNHNSTLLNIPPRDWNSKKPQLALYYIATRPIHPGDELFLDYGPEWHHAWEDHVLRWRLSDLSFLVPHGRDYVSAVQWNRRHEDKDVLWTAEEIEDDASRRVPSSLQLRCHSGILSLPPSKYYQLRWEVVVPYGADSPEYGYPCRVVDRTSHGDQHSYTVVMAFINDAASPEIQELKVSSVPRRLLKWFDVPHTTDIHVKPSFRHHLGLPDEMVPVVWRVAGPRQCGSDEGSCPRHFEPNQNDFVMDELPSANTIAP